MFEAMESSYRPKNAVKEGITSLITMIVIVMIAMTIIMLENVQTVDLYSENQHITTHIHISSLTRSIATD